MKAFQRRPSLALRTGAQRTDLTVGSWERGRFGFGRRRSGERGRAATAAEAVAFQQGDASAHIFQTAVGLAPVEAFAQDAREGRAFERRVPLRDRD